MTDGARKQRSPRRSLPVAACLTALGSLACSPALELPEVRTPLATNLGCPPSEYGKVATPVWIQPSDGSVLMQCAFTEFAACRPGRVTYELRVGAHAELLALSMGGSSPVTVRTC